MPDIFDNLAAEKQQPTGDIFDRLAAETSQPARPRQVLPQQYVESLAPPRAPVEPTVESEKSKPPEQLQQALGQLRGRYYPGSEFFRRAGEEFEVAGEAYEPQPGETTFERVAKGVTRAGVGVAHFPFQLAEAAVKPPETEAERTMEAIARTQVGGDLLAPLARVIKRVGYDPQAEMARVARERAEQGKTGEALGYSMAAGVPIFGPIAAQAGERIKEGDIAGGLAEAAAFAALPRLQRAAGRGLRVARLSRRATRALSKGDYGTAVEAALEHQLLTQKKPALPVAPTAETEARVQPVQAQGEYGLQGVPRPRPEQARLAEAGRAMAVGELSPEQIEALIEQERQAASGSLAGGAMRTSAGLMPEGVQPTPGVQTSVRAMPSTETTRTVAPSTTAGPSRTFNVGEGDFATGRMILQPIDDVNTLVTRAEEAKPQVEAGLQKLAADLTGIRLAGVRVKGIERLHEKLADRPAETISDYLGARLWAESPSDVGAVVARLGEVGRIVQDSDFLSEPRNGYRARHVQLELPNGMTLEVQIVPREIGEIQSATHVLYEQLRTKQHTDAEYLALKAELEAQMSPAWERFVVRNGVKPAVEAAPAAPPPPEAGLFAPAEPAPPPGEPLMTALERRLVPTESIEIRAEEMQPRMGPGKHGTSPGQVQALAESMRAQGFDPSKPLRVWEDPQTGKLILMGGHHRIVAAEEAGIKSVPVEIVRELPYEEAVRQARRSNTSRAPMHPVELGNQFAREMAEGVPLEQVAKAHGGLRTSVVEDYTALSKLAPRLQELARQDLFETQKAIALAKAVAKYEIPPEIQMEIFENVVKQREITPAQLGTLLDTFVPSAMKQISLFGEASGVQIFQGLRPVMEEYLAQTKELRRSRGELKGFLKNIERRQREGQPITKATLQTKNAMAREVARLDKQLAKMEKEAGSGKIYKTMGQALREGRAEREPAVRPERMALRAEAPGLVEPRVLAEEAARGMAEPLVGVGRKAGYKLAAPRRPEPKVRAEQTTFPGMKRAVEEQQAAAESYEAERLRQEMEKPPESIEEAAGAIERESPLFRGKGPQGTLYSNPLVAMAKLYSELVGRPLWEKGTALLMRMTPEFVKRGLVTRYGQPAEYVEAAGARKTTIGLGLEAAEKTGARLTKDLSQLDQQALGKFYKGELSEADLRQLRNEPRWNDAIEAAKEARAAMDSLGGEAVVQGLLSEQSFFRNYGKYMPRLYRKWEVNYETLLRRYAERRPTRLDLSRFKQRQDIPEHIRALMGEILEPGYPVAKGLAQIRYDVETAKLFNFVADHPEWAAEDLNTLWTQGKNPTDYVQMPETKKLGRLSGKYVHKYIADDLNQIVRVEADWQKITHQLITEWKTGKVILSPTTHARNMMSNTILAHLGGLPMARVDLYYKALSEVARNGPMYQAAKKAGMVGRTFSAGELEGLLDSWNKSAATTVPQRLAEVMNETANVLRGKKRWEGKVLTQFELTKKAAKLYQAEEQWFKMAKVLHNLEQGMDLKAAVVDAEKWLFDYSEVPKWVDWSRRSPVGAPFLTFTYKALPRVLESAVVAPWRIGGILALLYYAQQEAAKSLGISEDQRKAIEAVLPDRMRGKIAGLSNFLLLPFKDKYGQLQFLDLTYILPWGDIGETGGMGREFVERLPGVRRVAGLVRQAPVFGSPFVTLAAEIGTNRSTYTGKKIYNETDTTGEVAGKISQHIYRALAPSLAPGGYGETRLRKAITGQPDYFGRTSTVPTAVASTMMGLKVSPVDVERERFFREKEAEDLLEELERQAFQVMNDQRMSPAEQERRMEQLREKADRLVSQYQQRFYGEPAVRAER